MELRKNYMKHTLIEELNAFLSSSDRVRISENLFGSTATAKMRSARAQPSSRQLRGTRNILSKTSSRTIILREKSSVSFIDMSSAHDWTMHHPVRYQNFGVKDGTGNDHSVRAIIHDIVTVHVRVRSIILVRETIDYVTDVYVLQH